MHNHAQVSTQGQYKLECEEIVARDGCEVMG